MTKLEALKGVLSSPVAPDAASRPDAVSPGHATLRSQLAALRQRVAGLDPKRLSDSLIKIKEGYQDGLIAPYVLAFSEANEPTTDLYVIRFGETRMISAFNDPLVNWESYFWDAGRTVALAERDYLQQALLAAADTPFERPETAAAFSVQLRTLAEDMEAAGHAAGTIFVPAVASSLLYRNPEFPPEWNAKGQMYIRLGHEPVPVYVSGHAAPLDRLILVGNGAGRWRVVADSETRESISIAIGASALYGHLLQIEIIAVVKAETHVPSLVKGVLLPAVEASLCDPALCLHVPSHGDGLPPSPVPRALRGVLDLHSAADALAIVAQYVPQRLLTPRVQYLVEDLFDEPDS